MGPAHAGPPNPIYIYTYIFTYRVADGPYQDPPLHSTTPGRPLTSLLEACYAHDMARDKAPLPVNKNYLSVSQQQLLPQLLPQWLPGYFLSSLPGPYKGLVPSFQLLNAGFELPRATVVICCVAVRKAELIHDSESSHLRMYELVRIENSALFQHKRITALVIYLNVMTADKT